MKRILLAALLNLAQGVAAEPAYVEAVPLNDGRILTTQMGEWGTELVLGDEILAEDYQIALLDGGDMGVVVEFAHGGNSCPWRYKLIDKDSGDFRDAGTGEVMHTFGECERLLAVVPEANLIITWYYDATSYGRTYIWNGYAMIQGTLPIPSQDAPDPTGGAQVTRWNGAYPLEILRDPVEQTRLRRVLSDDEFEMLAWYVSFQGPAELRDGFLVAEGCVKYSCDAQNGIFAIRVSDGVPFVRILDDGEVILRIPAGESVPSALLDHAARYP